MSGERTMVVAASAPGKVLMTGGYLILERPNSGLVLSTNARFYAIVKPLFEEPKSDSCAGAWTDVKLTSPQLSREGMYKLDLENLTIQCVSSSETGNPFVEYAVQYSVAAAQAAFDKNMKDLLLQGLGITILGCNDFYSYRNQIEELGLPLTTESLANFPPFTSITFNVENVNGGNCKPEVAKTGLGSSAAMTTAVVASVLHYLGVVKLSSSKDYQARKDTADLDVVHKIAQTAHCVAQGKIGSGFDVCSAVYGSQRYVRFSPELISSAQGAERAVPLPEVIAGILKGKWDHEKTEFSLPPLVTLLLGEPGTGGSSTPSMWIEQAFEPNKEAVVNALLGAKDAMLLIRSLMRKMGEAAGVPIEPESQTRLLDATMKLEGVMLAGVPGAGGFDAIFAVILGDSSKNVTQVWSSLNVLALLVREYPCGVCVESVDPRTNAVTSTVSSVHSQ
ncbi:phosphomevalonate kinase, peroxisomal-like isoform X4 [Prosopis cineraria]|uniref:phosphomevalonate kinase, peroxisomal-like isoform X4 n=1 Tax=Prosopis cineraria TaxID=364024 RepID=UPI00240EE260|nr:phosphomevalonate kinase, peroxisomal-like isoform X4 [Prosopis cineraria]XP_054792143.1 phosphomevalonate kinase, peroxisomal-like isoform X4 [Prosopis cineraria]